MKLDVWQDVSRNAQTDAEQPTGLTPVASISTAPQENIPQVIMHG
jgi:hypothetical protein